MTKKQRATLDDLYVRALQLRDKGLSFPVVAKELMDEEYDEEAEYTIRYQGIYELVRTQARTRSAGSPRHSRHDRKHRPRPMMPNVPKLTKLGQLYSALGSVDYPDIADEKKRLAVLASSRGQIEYVFRLQHRQEQAFGDRRKFYQKMLELLAAEEKEFVYELSPASLERMNALAKKIYNFSDSGADE